MSIIDKQLLLEELGKKLEQFLPAPELRRALEAAGETLAAYTVESLRTGDEDDSEGMIRLFLDAKRTEGRSPRTVERYSYVLHAVRQALPVPLEKATVYHLRAYLSDEMARGVKASTLETRRSVLSSFYGWLDREGLIGKNPTSNLATIKQQKEVRTPFSHEEILRLQDATTSRRDAALIAFLLSSGCRVSEACSVNREDLDLKAKRLIVLGKGAKERTVYLDDEAVYRITLFLEDRKDDSPALFPGRATSRMTPSGVRKALAHLGRTAGVEDVHPHRFRRTLATTLIDRGMAVQDVAAVLGHDKLDTTMRYVYQSQANIEHAFRRAI